MGDIVELEKRISAALMRLQAALEAAPPPAPGASAPADAAEIARLAEALAVERDANAQLTERVRAIRERQDATVVPLEKRIEVMTAQLDTQGIELQRMRKTNIQLREALRALREAVAAGITDAHLINKVMLAELDALRAARMAEMAEMEEILAELDPLLAEERSDA